MHNKYAVRRYYQKNSKSIIASKILQNCKIGRVPRADTVNKYELSEIVELLTAWHSTNGEDARSTKAIRRLSTLMRECHKEGEMLNAGYA